MIVIQLWAATTVVLALSLGLLVLGQALCAVAGTRSRRRGTATPRAAGTAGELVAAGSAAVPAQPPLRPA